uniref:SWIM-type domain-containing protein n=1 Tax=Cannabis sativa TaxID=3483 RepID=A0A803QJI4_CANSA
MIKKFGSSQLRGLFWAAAETRNFDNFKHIMEKIKEFNTEAHEWLSNIDFGHWTMSKFDTEVKVEHITNNFVESFNDWIDDHRYKPPIELLEGIRMQHTSMMYARKVTAERWDFKLTPKVHHKIQELLKRARHARVTRVGNDEFQVDYDTKSCTVRLNEGYCICGQWQARGIPCLHAAACINTTRADISDYCSPYFTTEMWKKSFEGIMHPIPDESIWPEFNDEKLLPPLVRRPPGRPKKHRRRRVAGEERPLPHLLEKQKCRKGVSSTKKCKNCK